ncbi:MAG TPA: nuclear transport factor 2 family protein [Gemmatimonadaceae bacterium]|nr:nuclear transport factor 2 family protein [Gemmatimonadaceae bacterium]
MSDNKRTVERYMDGFRHTDRSKILSCLTEDVEWEIPGFFSARGRAEFESHIVDEGFTGSPVIDVIRLVEENDVVVAEGTVRANRTDGTAVNLVFCDVFDMRLGKIRRLVSYLVVAASSR